MQSCSGTLVGSGPRVGCPRGMSPRGPVLPTTSSFTGNEFSAMGSLCALRPSVDCPRLERRELRNSTRQPNPSCSPDPCTRVDTQRTKERAQWQGRHQLSGNLLLLAPKIRGPLICQFLIC